MTSRQDSRGTPDVGASGGSADWWQFAIVAMAALALVVAALTVPPLGPGADSKGPTGVDGADGRDGIQGAPSPDESDGGGEANGDGGGGTPDGETGGGSGGAGSEGGDIGTGSPSNRTVQIGNRPPLDSDEVARELETGCWVVAHGRPVPGTMLNVSVWHDRDPVSDRPAWFDGRFVGRTGADGRVAGPVPYETEFEVTVGVPEVTDCEFVTAVPADRTSPASLGAPTTHRARPGRSDPLAGGQEFGTSLVVGTVGPGEALESVGPGEALGTGGPGEALESVGPGDALEFDGQTAVQGGTDPVLEGNETVSETYTIEGDIAVAVNGTAYPGATVGIEASLGGIPVVDGRVSADGRRVGRTDHGGRYRLQVPADAAGEIAIRVRRGDFAGSARVEVHDLRLSLAPARPLPIPGQRATATVTLAGNPVGNASVTLVDERLGRTDGNGTLTFALPASPDGTVSARALGLDAGTPLWPLFVPTVAAVGVAVLVGGAATTRAWLSRGRDAGVRLAAVWSGVIAVLLGYVLGGGSGGLLAAVGVGILGLAALLREQRGSPGSLRAGGSARIECAVGRLRRIVLAAVDAVVAGLDRAVDLASGFRAWLAALRAERVGPLELFRSLPAWITGGFRIALAGTRRAVGAGRARYGLRALSGLLAAGTAIGVSIWQLGPVGGLVVALVLALISWITYAGRSAGRRDAYESARTEGTSIRAAGQPDRDGPSLRYLWRRFARTVEPGRWRTRSPGEIARVAVDSGLPPGPVRQLTDGFRASEYGGRTPDEEETRRAREAYETLRAALAGDGEGEEP